MYAANQADFLKLKDGTEIRLDRLISVNGNPLDLLRSSIMAIQLKIDRVLQGSFDLKALNLLFVSSQLSWLFHLWFPRQQAALEVSSVGLNVLGLSTAFEDFEYNTAANTELLLTEMKLVGATRKR